MYYTGSGIDVLCIYFSLWAAVCPARDSAIIPGQARLPPGQCLSPPILATQSPAWVRDSPSSDLWPPGLGYDKRGDPPAPRSLSLSNPAPYCPDYRAACHTRLVFCPTAAVLFYVQVTVQGKLERRKSSHTALEAPTEKIFQFPAPIQRAVSVLY